MHVEIIEAYQVEKSKEKYLDMWEGKVRLF